MNSIRPRNANQVTARGISLVELIIVVSIIGLLASIAYPALGGFKRKAEEVTCTGRLKRLHGAFDAYMGDHEQWPQVPEEVQDAQNEEETWEWYYYALKDYGATERDWLCPTEERDLAAAPMEERPDFHSSYIPTPFDSKTITPYRWPQPWLIERGNFHKSGARMLMPDGSIRYAPESISDAFAAQ